MANNLKQTPDQDEYNPAHDVGQDGFDKIIDHNFSPGDERTMEDRAQHGSAEDLASREAGAVSDDSASSASEKNTSREGLSEQEDGANWEDSTSIDDVSPSNRIKDFFGHKKRVLYLSAIIIPTITVIGLSFSFLQSALGIVNLKETAVSRLVERADDSMTRRMNRVMYKKFSQDFTTGCTIKVKCRYKGMSKREVAKFNKRNKVNGVRLTFEDSIIPGKVKITGIERYSLPIEGAAVDKNGNIGGKTIKRYSAREFRTALKKDPAIAKSMTTFYKSYVQYTSGLAGRAMLKRAGVNLGKKTVQEGDEKDETKKNKNKQRNLVEAAQEGTNEELSEVAQKRYDDLPDDAKATVEDRTSQIKGELEDPSKTSIAPDPSSSDYDKMYGEASEKFEKSASGVGGFLHPNPLHFLLPYCSMRALVQTANQVRKVNQTIQLIKFSALFYTIADQIKAGDATPQTTEAMGTAMSILMTQDKSGLTGFDSLGYNWITKRSVKAENSEDVTKFQNGGLATGFLGTAVSATTSGIGPLCKITNSAWATAGFLAIDVVGVAASAMSGGALTPLYAAAKTGSRTAVKGAAEKMIKDTVEEGVKNVIERKIKQKVTKVATKNGEKEFSKGRLIWNAINNKATRLGAMTALFLYGTGPAIEILARSGSKAVTQDLVGPDSGNAFYAGAGALNSKTSQAQGLQPISAKEAAQQDKSATKSTLARAKLEGINQLDASNQYSLANKFALALAPAFGQFNSPSTFLGGFSRLYASAMNNTLGTALAEENDIAQYQFCQDEDYLKSSTPIAGDPFCNPQFGFEPEVINGTKYDPEKIADYLYDSGLVDDNGEPIGEFTDFIGKCIESETTIGQDEEGNVESDCVNRDDKHRAMRLYCIDSSIDTDMKEETEGNCATQDELNNGSESSSAGTGNWSIPDGVDDNITNDLKAFLDEVAKHTSYEPICTTTTGGTHAEGSDHYSGNACDFGSVANNFGTNNAQPGQSVPRGDELAAAALIAAGVDESTAKKKAKQGLTPGVDDVQANIGGTKLRVQVIWKTSGHFDHVHIGVKKL